MKHILFVCTGNICRSPSAEAVLQHYVDMQGQSGAYFIDSAGTHGYHIGNAPDERAIRSAAMRGIAMDDLYARKVKASDFNEFDLIIAMDQGHFEILTELKPKNTKARIKLFCDYLPPTKIRDVPDPYYGTDQGFEVVLDMLEEGCQNMIEIAP